MKTIYRPGTEGIIECDINWKSDRIIKKLAGKWSSLGFIEETLFNGDKLENYVVKIRRTDRFYIKLEDKNKFSGKISFIINIWKYYRNNTSETYQYTLKHKIFIPNVLKNNFTFSIPVKIKKKLNNKFMVIDDFIVFTSKINSCLDFMWGEIKFVKTNI
jgi:hypothetical protein